MGLGSWPQPISVMGKYFYSDDILAWLMLPSEAPLDPLEKVFLKSRLIDGDDSMSVFFGRKLSALMRVSGSPRPHADSSATAVVIIDSFQFYGTFPQTHPLCNCISSHINIYTLLDHFTLYINYPCCFNILSL